MVKIDFFVSPAYSVPAMSTSFRPKFTKIATSDRQPCRAGSALKRVESRRLDRFVHIAPVHVLVTDSVPHHELVVRRPASVVTSSCHKWPFGGECRLPASQSLLVESRGAQVPVDAA